MIKKFGYASNVVDGDPASYWHSQYSGVTNAMVANPKKNHMVITLANPDTVAGVTILPRQDAVGNGLIQQFTVEVQQNGSTEWVSAYAQTSDTWRRGTDYVGSPQNVNWASTEAKSEREFHFDREYENVKKVRFTITRTDGATYSDTGTNDHIAAAELGILRKTAVKAPTVSAEFPEAETALPNIETVSGKPVKYGDTTENPADVSGDFWLSHEGVLKGTAVVEDVEKLRISSQQGLAITFQYKCGHLTGKSTSGMTRLLKKGENEYNLGFQNNHLAFCANTNQDKPSPSARGRWPQREVSTELDFNETINTANKFSDTWHEIAVCCTQDHFSLFLDGTRATIKRNWREYIELEKAGSLVINPENDLDACYKDFKIYSNLGVGTEEVTTTTRLNEILADKTPVFALGEIENPAQETRDDYETGATTWKDEDGQTVTSIVEEDKAYTASVELTAKGHTKFTDDSKPAKMTLTVPGGTEAENVVVDLDPRTDVEILENGKKMRVSHTFEPVEVGVGVTTDSAATAVSAAKGTVRINKTKTVYNGKAEFTAEPVAGYAFEGWYTDPSGSEDTRIINAQCYHKVETIKANQTLYARFVPKETNDKFRVTVWKKADENSDVWLEERHWEGKYNDDREGHVVDLSQVQLPADKEFSHWEEKNKPGIVFSAERGLRFRIPGNLDLIAVFKDGSGSNQTGTAWAKVSDTYLIRNENNLSDNAKVRFVGKLHIPEGWTLNETGLFWTGKDSGTVTTLQVDGDQPLPEYVKKIEAPKINVSYQFSATVSGVPVGKTIRGVIYAKMTDANGNTSWYYSDEVPVTHTDIRNPQPTE